MSIPASELLRHFENNPAFSGVHQTLAKNPLLADELAGEWSGDKDLRQTYHGHFERFADVRLKSVPVGQKQKPPTTPGKGFVPTKVTVTKPTLIATQPVSKLVTPAGKQGPTAYQRALARAAKVNLSPEEKVKAQWNKSDELRAEFGGNFDVYAAYMKAEAGGSAKILKGCVITVPAPKHVVA